MRARSSVLALLRLYQRAVSPYVGPCCRFVPSCSEYMIQSISLNGVVIGVADGVGRLLRCHPFHRGGYDPPRRIRLRGTREECRSA